MSGEDVNKLGTSEYRWRFDDGQFVRGVIPLNKLGSNEIDVNVQDQTTDTVILPMANEIGSSSLISDAVVDTYSVTVTSSTGMSVGDHFRIIDQVSDKYYAGTILGISGNVINLDALIDFAYLSGSEVTYSNINLAVDGSTTPVFFNLRTGSPSISSDIDITRIIVVCQCDTSVDLNKFGNLPALTRGLLFRKGNGTNKNIFNIKNNADFANIAYDWTPFVASNPSQAVDGFACRLTFAGQNKIGVALRIKADSQLSMIVQDDLTDLVSLYVILEGHVVEPSL